MKKSILSLLITVFYVLSGASQSPSITLNTAKPNGSYILLSLKAKSETTIDIDFGNGTTEKYTVKTEITPITHAVSGSEIKVYTSDPQKIIYLDCRNSSLTSMDLSGVTNLEWLECQENQLASLEISKNINLKYLNCNSNQLTALDISKNTHLLTIQCKENKLTYATLPVETAYNAFICAPQQPLAISSEYNTGLAIDLSNVYNTGGNKTSYTWKTKAGANLTKGTDYTMSNGKTIFLKTQADSVYCEMTNAAFPDFKDNDVLKTTNTKVAGQILSVVSMTTQKAPGSEFNLILQAWENNTVVYIDYGNGLPVAKTIHSDETPVSGTLVNADTIKIYSAGMYYVDCSFNEITSVDISKNQELTSINCYKNQLMSLDITKNADIAGIDCGENRLTAFDVSKNKQLTWLSIYKNQLTSIDLSKNTELTYLDVSDNQLSALDVTQNTKLSSFNCANNSLTGLDVSQNPALFHLECANNKLTFATLPIRSMTEYRYAPQQSVSIAKHYHKGDMIDLSELNTAGGANTLFTLKTKEGTTLTPGTHYSIDNGKITLLETQTDSLYCIMTNSKFPYLKGTDALVTTFTKVSESATGIGSVEEEGSISPNPVANTLYIHMPNHGNMKFSIFNMACAKVQSGITRGGNIDVSGLHAGIYLLRLEESAKQLKIVRFVKQ
ncbi:MAG TPA: T9SS type A sorting domain-containing protein [Bacteroidales bacterium]|nr:T9SS type A sorting domain-containing protein [Bacteroidales bacterium]